MNVRPLGSNLGSFSRKLSWLIAERRAPEPYFEVKGLICHNENKAIYCYSTNNCLKGHTTVLNYFEVVARGGRGRYGRAGNQEGCPGKAHAAGIAKRAVRTTDRMAFDSA